MVKQISKFEIEVLITALLNEEVNAREYGGPVNFGRALVAESLREKLSADNLKTIKVVG